METKKIKYGMTLDFFVEPVGGIRAEYIQELAPKTNINELSVKLAKSFAKKETKAISFVGISDMFVVSQKIREFSIFGRSTLFEVNTKKKALKLITENASKPHMPWLIVSLVFFYDAKNPKDRLTLVATCPIKNDNLGLRKLSDELVINRIKENICAISDINITPSLLEFLGVENTHGLLSINLKQTPYLVYESVHATKSELRKGIMSNKAIEKFLQLLKLSGRKIK